MSATYFTSKWSAHETCTRTTRVSDKAFIHPTAHCVRRGWVCQGRRGSARGGRFSRALVRARADRHVLEKEVLPDGGARSATLERMTALSLTWVVRGQDSCADHSVVELRGGHLQAGGVKPAFFAYFLCGGKESKCCPAQGRRKQTTKTARTGQNRKNTDKRRRQKPLPPRHTTITPQPSSSP